MVNELAGQTLYIIGAGKIGKEIAKKAKAFDMNVIGLKKHPETLQNFDEVLSIDKLKQVLEKGYISGVGLDVFHEEPLPNMIDLKRKY